MTGLGASGTWVGGYTYPEAGGPWETGTLVPFTMQLRVSWRGDVTGSIQEDPTLGAPEAGTIHGHLGLRSVRLVKNLPVFRFWAPGRLITFQEWFSSSYPGSDFPPQSLPHPSVHLTGSLSRIDGRIDGVWQVDPFSVVDDSGKWKLDFPAQQGRWFAARMRDAA